jgi:hypothetical protein
MEFVDQMCNYYFVGGSATHVKTVASDLAKCNLDLVALQEVRWVKVGSQPADDYKFFYGNENVNHHLGTGFFVHKTHFSSYKYRIC